MAPACKEADYVDRTGCFCSRKGLDAQALGSVGGFPYIPRGLLRGTLCV